MEKNLSLNMSRIFKCDSKTLFQAIAEGALFKYTGAKMDKLKMDFREGGALYIEWTEGSPVNGEFKEIRPHDKIAFTWNYESKELGRQINSLVTIVVKEKYGKSTLTLVHDGFETFEQVEEHSHGWDDAIKDLQKSFRDFFAKLENNPTGLDLTFKVKKTIKAPRAQVFQAVYDKNEIAKYFGVKAGGSLVEGSKIEWKFEGHPLLTLDVHQVIENELIKFQWGNSHVCFSFRDKAENKTEVVIEATGWEANQKGLDDSYSECDGWMEFLVLLKFHFEKSR